MSKTTQTAERDRSSFETQIDNGHIYELPARLAKAKLEVHAVPKNAKNPHGKYAYASVDDVYHAVRVIMARHGLDIHVDFAQVRTEVKPGAQGKDVLWLVVDALLWISCPEGAEVPVKRHLRLPYTGPQATESAVSYLAKSFIRQRLQLETGEYDDEFERSEPPADAPAVPAVSVEALDDGLQWTLEPPDEPYELPREWAGPLWRALNRKIAPMSHEDAASWLARKGVADWYARLPEGGKVSLGAALDAKEGLSGDDG